MMFKKYYFATIVIVLAVTITCQADPNLLAHYEFSNDVTDSAGSNDGTIQGNPGYVTGPTIYGNAIDLDGTGDYVIINDGIYPIGTGTITNMTAAAWIKTTNTLAGWQSIVSQTLNWRLSVGYGLCAFHPGNIGEVRCSHTLVNDNQWHHLAGVYEYDNGKLKLYVDGVLQNTIDGSGTNNNASGVWIGNHSYFPDRDIDGAIDDVRLYDRALSAEEIDQLYQGGLTKAHTPNPEDEVSGVVPSTGLGWTPDAVATSIDVYFGTVSGSLPLVVSGDGSLNSVSNAQIGGPLDLGETYYWRVDTDGATGNEWSFTVYWPAATVPSPSDGQYAVDIEANLSWTPDAIAASHDVYFGTSEAAVTNAERLAGDADGSGEGDFNDILVVAGRWLQDPADSEPYADLNGDGNVNLLDYAIVAEDFGRQADAVFKGNQDANSYDPGPLELDQNYFWRIDEVNGPNTWGGEVWEFTTFSTGTVAVIDNIFDVPTIKVNGSWMTMPGYSNLHPYPDYLVDFEAAGTKVYDFPSTATMCPGVTTVWTGPDTWDYSVVDLFFDRVIAADEDALIIPRLYNVTPSWWEAANPAEMELRHDGSSTSHASIASEKWRQDMAYALEHYLDYIEAAGYSDNVAGYELSGLMTEEWYHWTSNSTELGGYSVPTRDAFRQWLEDKYVTNAALQTSWDNGSVTFDNAAVPSQVELFAGVNSQTFRVDGSGDLRMNVVDWYQFWNELIPDTIDYLAAVIKNKTNNTKLVGAFYGFMYEFQASPEFGHNALKKYNESKNLDYAYVTSSYENRGFGGVELLRAPAYSVQLHDKLWYVSNDLATIKTRDIFEDYFHWPPSEVEYQLGRLGYTDTIEKNQWMLRRAAGFNTCNGFYQNFLDLHACPLSGYYTHPDLMAEVANLNQFYDRSKNYDRSSVSEILIVSDEFSCNYIPSAADNWNNTLLYTSLTKPQAELTQIGAPADHILIDDIALANISQYKLVVFLNCWHMSDSQRTLVDSLKGDGRVLVFCYAPGYYNGRNSSVANMLSVSEMNMAVSGLETLAQPRVEIMGDHPLGQAIINAGAVNPFGPTKNVCKRIWVDDGTTTRLGRDPDVPANETMAFKKMTDPNWTSIYSVTSYMPSKVYRELARFAGVNIYNEGDDTFYANSSYVCIHASSAGSRTITWPQAVDVYDAFEEGPALQLNTTTYTRSYQLGETMIYRYEISP